MSLYNQSTKRGLNTLSFDEFFTRGIEQEAKIQRIVENWGEAVGFDALRVRTLEAATTHEGGLLGDVLSALDLDPGLLAKADPESMKPANVGVTWEQAEYVRKFSRRTAEVLEKADTKEISMILASRKPRFSPVYRSRRDKERSKIANLYQSSFPRIIQTALDSAGMARPVQYLTPEQADQLERSYQQQLKAIAAMVPDAKLDHMPPPVLSQRPFEPDFGHISSERRDAIGDAFRAAYNFDNLPAKVRDVFRAMHG